MAVASTPSVVPVPPYIGPKPDTYALPSAIVVFALIGLTCIVQWSRLIWRRRRPTRALAAVRAFSYTGIPYLELGLSAALLISAVFIGLLLYIFVPGQIYRAPKLSPLGLRAGYVGIALIPFVYTFGSRINPLGWLSRVSHERWMVYHQYGARIVLFFSLLHGMMIIHSRYLIGGWPYVSSYFDTKGVSSRFFYKEGVLVNGIVGVGTMVWMIFSSVFRHRSYEFFVIQHIVSILLLTICLVAHLQVDLDEGINYVYGTVAIWGFSILIRVGRVILSSVGVSLWSGKATLRDMSCGVTEISVDVRNHAPGWWNTIRGSWVAGQHVYLRLPGWNAFQSHPFTIASTYSINSPSEGDAITRLRLLVKTRDGLTKSIAAKSVVPESASSGSQSGVSVPVILDGPYGGLSERLEGFDDVLLIAGGIGATFVWPLAEHLERLGKSYKIVWTVRSVACLDWFAESRVSKDRVILHVSDPLYASQASSQTSFDKSEPNASGSNKPEVDAGTGEPVLPPLASSPPADQCHRLDMANVVNDFIATPQTQGRLAVLACGPGAMLNDIGRAVARAEWKIAKGQSEVQELWLHREQFSH